MYNIRKILNNNALLVVGETEQTESILLGKGIGFGKKIGDCLQHSEAIKEYRLAQNDGNVSALLHLDMPSLGPLDVYASITPEKSVFTKFYLESDEMIDFIAENIHVLNERLEKRGYKMKSEMIKKGEEGDVKELLIKEQGGIPKTTGHLGFDMRA